MGHFSFPSFQRILVLHISHTSWPSLDLINMVTPNPPGYWCLWFPWCPKIVFMLEEVCSQQHCPNITIKLVACLQNPLESCIPLICMSCVENFVMWVDPSLHENKRFDHKNQWWYWCTKDEVRLLHKLIGCVEAYSEVFWVYNINY